jgi:muramoyltetrapeptide carboxypeptidase
MQATRFKLRACDVEVYTPILRAPLISGAKKPPALPPGGTVRIISPASPASAAAIRRGIAELKRLGYNVCAGSTGAKADGYFATPLVRRTVELATALGDRNSDAVICTRGGYGSAALLDRLRLPRSARAKLLIGFSDITSLHIYLWQRFRWPSVYGPMVAAALDRGPGKPEGYDRASFVDAVGGKSEQWSLALDGESVVRGEASGILLGGCLTLLQTSLATPWELDTRGAILLLEDRAVRPYQLDRMLLHLAQAGKLRGLRGIILNEFPDSGEVRGGITTRDVCRRMLGNLGVPVVFGAAVGHTARPMLTIPLGVRARLRAHGKGTLEILETVVTPQK